MLNFAPSAFALAQRVTTEPVHRSTAAHGLMAGTRVETAEGWRCVETLVAGDLVHTLDGGLRPLAEVERVFYRGPRGPGGLRGVLQVPVGALMNCSPFFLLPDQHLMFRTPYAEDILGTPLTLVPGRALEGYRGIAPVRIAGASEVVILRFSDEEAVWCNTGILAHCPSVRQAADATASEHFTTLSVAQAQALLGLIEIGALNSGELGRTDDMVWAA